MFIAGALNGKHSKKHSIAPKVNVVMLLTINVNEMVNKLKF